MFKLFLKQIKKWSEGFVTDEVLEKSNPVFMLAVKIPNDNESNKPPAPPSTPPIYQQPPYLQQQPIYIFYYVYVPIFRPPPLYYYSHLYSH